MTRCQRGKLEASAVKKRVCANQKRLDAFLDECCEGGFDFLFVARINDFDLRPDSRASCRYVLRYGLRIFSIFRVDESGNTSCLRHQFAQQAEAFGTQTKFSEVKIDTGRISARSRQASNKTKLDRIVGDTEQN